MYFKKNLDELVYDRILDDIFSATWEFGDVLNADELAARYNISRTPVVQALKRLATDGILSFKSNGKPWFPPVTEKTLEDILGVRELLEHYAVRLICEQRIPVANDELYLCYHRCEQFRLSERRSDASREDLRFHHTIVDSLQNEALSSVYDRIQKKFISINYLSLRNMPRWTVVTPESSQDHLHLFEALQRFDLEDASRCVSGHLQIARALVSEKLTHYAASRP